MEAIPSSALSHIALGHIPFFQNSVISNRDMWDPHVLVHTFNTTPLINSSRLSHSSRFLVN